MPYQLTWAPEPHIVLTTVTGISDAAQSEEWAKDIIEMMDNAATESVHCIVDLRKMERITANILKMPIMMQFRRHPKLGWTVILGATPIIGFWIEMLSLVASGSCKLCKTMEDANTFLLGLVSVAEEHKAALHS